MKTITFNHKINGVLTSAASVRFRDPTNTFGIRRTDTNGILVAAGTPLTQTATGRYEYVIDEPALGLTYEYWLEVVYLGNTDRVRQFLTGTPTAGAGGAIPIPTGEYVTTGVELVSCGDSDLESFLNVHANLVWAMQVRRGVVLDLRFQYFVLALIDLALDHVRMLIDTEVMNQQMQETGYTNGSNVSDASMIASHFRTSSSTQSSAALQSFIRSALRTTSSTMVASAGQSSARNGSGSDTSTQLQDTDSLRDTVNDSINTTTPALHSTNRQYKNSHMESRADSYSQETITHYNLTVPFAGSISGQSGIRTTPQPQNESQMLLQSADSAEGHSVRSTKVVGNGLAIDDATTEGDGSRTNNVTRQATSSMSGSAQTTSSASMASTSHAEAHRSSESTSHAESASHSEMVASGSSSRVGQGASSMVSAQAYAKNYYDQIFESLKTLWENTKAQIEKLEQQVQMPQRVVIQRLSVRTPRAALTVNGALGNLYLTQNPFGTPFDRTVR